MRRVFECHAPQSICICLMRVMATPRAARMSCAACVMRAAGNVLLAASREAPHGFRAKVCDFGMARNMDVATRIDTRTYGAPAFQQPGCAALASSALHHRRILSSSVAWCARAMWRQRDGRMLESGMGPHGGCAHAQAR